MHRITLTLDGPIQDTVTIELDDAEAFARFMAGKKLLGDDATLPKKRGRRATRAEDTVAATDTLPEREA